MTQSVDLGTLKSQLSSLTVVQIAQLVKELEKEWGVEAPKGGGMMMAMPAGGGAAEAPKVEEKTEFTVELTTHGSNKIAVIKEIRAITGLGLKEAKELVDGVPKTVKESISKEEADKIKEQLEKAGGTVTLK